MNRPEPLSDDEIGRLVGRLPDQLEFVAPYFAFAREIESLVAARYEARIAELEREPDALRADAQRYRHLRDSGDTSIYAMRFDLEGDTPVDGPDLDASIDAARAAQKKTPATGDQS